MTTSLIAWLVRGKGCKAAELAATEAIALARVEGPEEKGIERVRLRTKRRRETICFVAGEVRMDHY